MRTLYLLWGFVGGLSLGVMVVACASPNLFPYTHYGMNTASGKLLANKDSGAPDLPVSDCNSNSENAAPCIVFFDSVYEQLKKDFINLSNAYSELQSRCPN